MAVSICPPYNYYIHVYHSDYSFQVTIPVQLAQSNVQTRTAYHIAIDVMGTLTVRMGKTRLIAVRTVCMILHCFETTDMYPRDGIDHLFRHTLDNYNNYNVETISKGVLT